MSREPKPYYRKTTKRWVCTIDGKRITLGPDKKAAHDKFRELMLNRNQVASELSTVYDLSQVYLDWCEQNRKRGTYLNQKRYLASFINSIGRRLKIGALKAHHITKWLETFDCTSTSKNDAVSIAQRKFNWAIGACISQFAAKTSSHKRSLGLVDSKSLADGTQTECVQFSCLLHYRL